MKAALIIFATGACFRLNGFDYAKNSCATDNDCTSGEHCVKNECQSATVTPVVTAVAGDGANGVVDNTLIITGTGFGASPAVTLVAGGAQAPLTVSAASDTQLTAALPSSIATTVPSASPVVCTVNVANGTQSASFAFTLARGAAGANATLTSPLSVALSVGNSGNGAALAVSKGSVDFSAASAVHYPAMRIKRSTAASALGSGSITQISCDAGMRVVSGGCAVVQEDGEDAAAGGPYIAFSCASDSSKTNCSTASDGSAAGWLCGTDAAVTSTPGGTYLAAYAVCRP